jgi:hypothetical protein
MRFKHFIFFDFGLLVQSMLKKVFFSFSKLVSNLGGSGNSSKNRHQATQIWNKKKPFKIFEIDWYCFQAETNFK